jgi:phospholipase C
VTGKYYYGDIPFAVLLGSHSPPRALNGNPLAPLPGTFFGDAAAGTLPAVSFVDPRFTSEENGTSADDHPHADIRAGEAFMNQVYDALRNSPTWSSTVFVINYDEWGGFFDHVPPGHAADVARKTSLRGFRVPMVVMSPFARRNHVAHQTLDHTSILRMIEWRWGLKPLTDRDKNAHNLANVLDFTLTDTTSPTYTVAPFDSDTGLCATAAQESGSEDREWAPLKKMALEQGWQVG